MVLACLLAGSGGVAGAAQGIEHHPIRFERLWLDHGLSQSNALSVLQDSQGFIWVGTENGLNRYDGYEFRHFRRQRGNPDALANDFIFDIAEDSGGDLWFATNGGGLARMDRDSEAFTAFRHDPEDPASIGSNIVRRVFVDEDGSVYAGTRGAGLGRLDPATGEFTHYRFPAGTADDGVKRKDNVFAIVRGMNGSLFVGGDHGLASLDPESGDAQIVGDFGYSVRAVFEESGGTLWVGTRGGGLVRIDAGSDDSTRFLHRPDDTSTISSDHVTAIFEDSDGRLWVGTTMGLNLVDRANGTFVRYLNDPADPTSIGSNEVSSIYQDRGGVLWVGTKMRGLNKWNPRSWGYGLENAEALSLADEQAPSVMSLVDDAEGTLWVGTFGMGLNAVDRRTGEVTHYRHDPDDAGSIGDNHVMSLMRDRDGRIWVGTMRSGIDIMTLPSGELERLRHDPQDPGSLAANGVMTMFEARSGDVWIGTFGGGLSVYDPDTATMLRYRNDPADEYSLSGNRVTSIAEDAAGRMWIGTDGAGLNLYDPASGLFHRYRHDPADPRALSDDTIYSIKVDAAGTVWIGTRGGGLDRVVGDAVRPDAVEFANRSQADGLSNDVIYGIEADASGRLWLSTNYGLSRYDPATDSFRNLHRRDGLQSDEFNFGAHYANDAGELFFGGTSGYNVFDPSGIRTNEVAPAIAITDFSDGDRTKAGIPLNDEGAIELSYTHDTVSFGFSALDFASPSANRYMYKLEGFDKDWVDLGTRRHITYTDLDDGNYLLRVKAANADGVWNETGVAIPVRVEPAPWDTWWAYLGYVAMCLQLAALLWYGHKAKIRREEAYSQQLEEAVAERTDELAERNKQLRALNEALQESSLSDPLTGLRNRRFVFEEISRDFETVHRRNTDQHNGIDHSDAADLVFMMIDLDNFKPINDTYGHGAGDQMLLEVRDVLLDTCRRSDYVVRWGGDEFVVVAKQTKPRECEALAERIRARIAAHNFMLPDGQIVRTTCSIGFSAYPLFRSGLDESDLDQVIGLADALMYEAKKQRNAWAGMFGPNAASTSYEIPEDGLEPTSVLFRARRAGSVSVFPHGSGAHEGGQPALTKVG